MPSTVSGTGVSTYRWSRAHVGRIVGLFAVVLGVSWLILGAATASGSVAPKVAAVAAGCTAAVLVLSTWLLLRPPSLLELSETGYRIRRLRGAGVTAADWSQVQSVQTRASTNGPAIVVDLVNGGTSTLPLSLLGLRALPAQQEMHERLNAAFGYRRLSEASG